MKIQQLLCWALLLSAVACTNDFDENASASVENDPLNDKIVSVEEGATRGALAIKVSEAKVAEIEASATRSGATRSGIESIDLVLDKIDASQFRRLFNDPLFEDQLRSAGLHRWYKVSFDDKQSLREAARALARSEEVEHVEYMHAPRHINSMSECKPLEASTRADETTYPMNDPELRRQWHYHNTGEIKRSVKGADINLFKAWEYCTGDESVVVAVLDQPIQTTHEDLKDNLWVNTFDADDKLKHGANFCTRGSDPIAIDWDYKEDDGSGKLSYPHHGTHVAGTVAAVNGNGLGVCGIAGGRDGKGGVRLMGCQIFYKKDNLDEAASQAFIWAANRGAHIAQCSFGFLPTATLSDWNRNYGYEVDAINYFINQERTNGPIDGGVVIFAAGNDGNTLLEGQQVKDKQMVPGAYARVIAVAATAPDNYPAAYTNYGHWVDISAPGGDSEFFGLDGSIFSTIVGTKPADSYGYSEGTSMACPHVSGVAALGLSYAAKLGKRFTKEEFSSMIRSSGNKVDDTYTGTVVSQGLFLTFDGWYTHYEDVYLDMADYKDKMGGGVIDAFRMLMAVEGTPVVTVGKGSRMTLSTEEILNGMGKHGLFVASVEPESETEAEMMGLTCSIENGTLTVTSSEVGATRILLKGKLQNGNSSVSGSNISLPIAVICREHQASNGGWL